MSVKIKSNMFRILPLAVVLAVLVATVGPAGAKPQGLDFKNPKLYPTGNPNEVELTSVTNADFNNDGKPDLAATNTSGASVSVFLQKSGKKGKKGKKKGFESATTIPVPIPPGQTSTLRPMGIISADFNRDGVADLAVTSPPSRGVFIFFGNGDGTFTFSQFYQTGTRAFGITAADLNGDSRTDLAITNLGPRGTGAGDLNRDTISVLLNNPPDGPGGAPDDSDGEFAPAVNYAAGDSPSSITAADLDGDGDRDLAVTNDRVTAECNDVCVFLNDGDGTYDTTPPQPFVAGEAPTAIANADFNDDGKLDLVVANLGPDQQAANDTVSVLLNTTTGGVVSFATTDYPSLDGPRAVTVADFDLDGDPDFAVSYENNDADPSTPEPDPGAAFISVYSNDGAGVFGPPVNFEGGVDSRGITSADFDKNGKPDLAAPDRSTTPDSVLVLRNSTKKP